MRLNCHYDFIARLRSLALLVSPIARVVICEPAFLPPLNFDAGCSRYPTGLSRFGLITLAVRVVHDGYVTSGIGMALGKRERFAAVERVRIRLDDGRVPLPMIVCPRSE